MSDMSEFTRYIVTFSNGILSDQEFFDYMYLPSDEKQLGSDKNFAIQKKFMVCDRLAFLKFQEACIAKYGNSLTNLMPIIILETEKIICNIINMIKNDTSKKYVTEKILLDKLESHTLLNDACCICLATANERTITSNVILKSCGHSVCQDCWSRYITQCEQLTCPMCRQHISGYITPMGVKLCNHPEFEKILAEFGKSLEQQFDEIFGKHK